jgi:hypothetical protein
MYIIKTLIDSNLHILGEFFTNCACVHGLVEGYGNCINVLDISHILRHTSLNLTKGSFNDPSIHELNLLIYTCMVITCVVNKYNAHHTVEIRGVLTIYGNTSLVLKGLTDTTLEKILVKLGKEQGVEWCFNLFEGIEVEVITHLIYPRKKNLVDIKC